MTFRVLRTPDEVARAERDLLEKLTPEERIELTWQLTLAQWGFKPADVPRLSRLHTRIIRRCAPDG